MTSRDIRQIYQDRYAGEKLVKVVGEAPLVKSIQNKHGVEIGGFAVDTTGKRVVVLVLPRVVLETEPLLTKEQLCYH